MNVMKKISLSLATVAIVATSSFSAQVLVGGSVPLINSIVGFGVTNLDFSAAGTNEVIATFIVDNNSSTFDVTWTLTNGAAFQKLGGTDQIAMTTAAMAPPTVVIGTLGTGGTAPAVDVSSGTGTWTSTQTTATSGYVVQMTASWAAAASTMLAGLYTEQVVFTIVATM